jgi:pimeloyl-ACP methyl ester carboxylesterase
MGSRPPLPLVFLPGAGGSAAFWRPVVERLADLGEARALGWPGFGEVPPVPGLASLDDLFRWLVRELPAGPSHVVAQSMGGVLAMRLALEHPGRVASLALVATSGGVDVAALGGTDWRAEYLAALPGVPRWFVDERVDLGPRLREVAAPALLLFGAGDPVSPPQVGRFLRSRLPRARLVIVDSDSHLFATERPDEVAALLREHVTAVEA